MKGRWHQFQAPVGGKALRFAMRCEDGQVRGLHLTDAGQVNLPRPLVGDLLALSALLRHGALPWEMVRLQTQGHIGAVIEAAEARRVELYGEGGA
jgi:hypothetical protein